MKETAIAAKPKGKKQKPKGALLSIAFCALIVYFAYKIICQQFVLSDLRSQKASLESDLQLAQKQQQELAETEESYNSSETVERLAREKLGFVYPNEKVFIDVSGK